MSGRIRHRHHVEIYVDKIVENLMNSYCSQELVINGRRYTSHGSSDLSTLGLFAGVPRHLAFGVKPLVAVFPGGTLTRDSTK